MTFPNFALAVSSSFTYAGEMFGKSLSYLCGIMYANIVYLQRWGWWRVELFFGLTDLYPYCTDVCICSCWGYVGVPRESFSLFIYFLCNTSYVLTLNFILSIVGLWSKCFSALFRSFIIMLHLSFHQSTGHPSDFGMDVSAAAFATNWFQVDVWFY